MTTWEVLKKLKSDTDEVFDKHKDPQKEAEEKLAELIRKVKGGESTDGRSS